ncbi:ubiquinone biosynthesis methyltransferase coq5 [Metarhizium rileyi]|uniref:Ubiquinone biosynthesis methyltransferase coq5 n=1 Tax=Metarhizium rileyi (strain RCEF 4871) TaxID=1649241 RepID=A0A167KE54_METRR|nr:ubiquinone biosynthesis methyltransferase coq5 [Metarhizium rileyi RCEF 4871]
MSQLLQLAAGCFYCQLHRSLYLKSKSPYFVIPQGVLLLQSPFIYGVQNPETCLLVLGEPLQNIVKRQPRAIRDFGTSYIAPTIQVNMMSPGSSLALLILGIMALIGLISWFLKSRVEIFVEALLAYKRKLTDTEQAAEIPSTAKSS